MSNGEICCLLQVCCPPISQERVDEVARELVKDTICDEAQAQRVAEWLIDRIDNAFGGTLVALLSSVATAVRENDKKHKKD